MGSPWHASSAVSASWYACSAMNASSASPSASSRACSSVRYPSSTASEKSWDASVFLDRLDQSFHPFEMGGLLAATLGRRCDDGSGRRDLDWRKRGCGLLGRCGLCCASARECESPQRECQKTTHGLLLKQHERRPECERRPCSTRTTRQSPNPQSAHVASLGRSVRTAQERRPGLLLRGCGPSVHQDRAHHRARPKLRSRQGEECAEVTRAVWDYIACRGPQHRPSRSPPSQTPPGRTAQWQPAARQPRPPRSPPRRPRSGAGTVTT